MELTIVTPESQRTIRIAWLEIETPAGNFVIQSGHAPMLVTLIPNHDIFVRLKNGKQENIFVRRGIVQITRRQTTIITI